MRTLDAREIDLLKDMLNRKKTRGVTTSHHKKADTPQGVSFFLLCFAQNRTHLRQY